MRRALFIVLSQFWLGFAHAQTMQENVFVHLNSHLFVTGETLYYSAYTRSTAGHLSGLSKVLYVELLGSDGAVYQTTLLLRNGRGHGEFFINSTLKTGNYQLVAYTRWMKNFKNYSRTTLQIVNPFKDPDESSFSAGLANEPGIEPSRSQDVRPEPMGVYGKRSLVTYSGKLQPGTYSVSVYRKYGDFTSPSHHLINQADLVPETENRVVNHVITDYLPEVREGLMRGKMTDSKGEPVPEARVMLSTPGEHYQIRSAITDTLGNFEVPYSLSHEDREAYLHPMDLDSGYVIIADSEFETDHPDFEYRMKKPDSLQIAELVGRSIRAQLYNAFPVIESYSDSLPKPSPQINFDLEFDLDEYTRFQTLRETFTEFIPTANIRLKRDPIIKMHFEIVPREEMNPPLVLLDGVYVSAAKMVEFNPYLIRKISILNQRYFLGGLLADGAVNFSTYEHNLSTFILDQNYSKITLRGLGSMKSYRFPDYSKANDANYPDQREQLFWEPQYELRDTAMEFQFYTSDVTGTFELVIQGITDEGNPISLISEFEVEDKQL